MLDDVPSLPFQSFLSKLGTNYGNCGANVNKDFQSFLSKLGTRLKGYERGKWGKKLSILPK